MNCKSFEDVVVDLARSMPMDASVRDRAVSHCAHCESCAAQLARQQSLTGSLKMLATEMKSATTPDHVQRSLITAVHRQALIRQSDQASHRWQYLAVAATLLVTVALGIIGYRMMPAEPVMLQVRNSPASQPTVQVTPEQPPAEIATTSQKPDRLVVKKQRARKLRPNVAAQSTFVSVVVGSVTDSETSEVASPFMPLGYTNPANIQDGAQVVRVELPRYAMARFGLPVNMERYDELVKADVWLGTDGVARAIRFVQ
jgi:hypothetical protein